MKLVLNRRLSQVLIFSIVFSLISLNPTTLDAEFGLIFYLFWLSLLNALVLIVPKYLDTVTIFFFLSMSAFYYGGQLVFLRAFNQFAYFSVVFDLTKEISGNTSSIQDFFIQSDVWYLILPFVGFMASMYVNLKSKRHVYSILQVGVSLLLVTFSWLTLTYFNINHVDQFSHEKKQVYFNLPNTNQFVQIFSLHGLLFRDVSSYFIEYPVFVDEVIENVPEVTIEQRITEMLQNQNDSLLNEYTGIFEGKNLLLIEAESLNYYAIHPTLTPTLYKLFNEGIRMNNYHAPMFLGSTSDTEFMALTSLLPANNGRITYHNYFDNVYPHTLARSFTQLGYFSFASHSNYGSFYNRTLMLPNLGFDFLDNVGLTLPHLAKDSEVIEHIKWIMYERDQYFSFLITYNGHQPYTVAELDPEFLTYYEKVNRTLPNWPEAEKVYLAKSMDLDCGLELLLKDYRKNNILDDLVIAIYSDHIPKGVFGQTFVENQEACSLSNGYELNCLNTPFFIWHSSAPDTTILTKSSPLDIAPSLYDLFNMPYNPNYLLGQSVFSHDNKGFSFDEFGVIQTNHFTYDILRDTIVHDWTQSEEVFRQQAQALYQKLQIGYKIVETNYFASQHFIESTLHQND